MQINQLRRKRTDFQQAVNEHELAAQLKSVLHGERIASVTELDGGRFNNTYRVETHTGSYILKVAPSPEATLFYNERHLMQREQAIAPVLQKANPLVPAYHAFFTIDNRSCCLQEFISGRTWHDEIDGLSNAENTILWQQLGQFARSFHANKGSQYGYPEPFTAHQHWREFILANVSGMLEDCQRLGVVHEQITAFQTHLENHADQLNAVTSACLCHGDLWPRNVLLDGHGSDIHITAVVDAERAYWGDPMSDWVLLLYGVPDAFWDGYGDTTGIQRTPLVLDLYKGMYFILNILEASRERQKLDAPLSWLTAVNQALDAS